MGNGVAESQSIRHLGVNIARGARFVGHVEGIRGVVFAVYGRMRWALRSTGGMTRRQARLLYTSMLKPMLLYGSEVWGEDGARDRCLRLLMSTQRTVLLGVCGAYSTVSHDAVRIVNGIPTVNLLTREKIQRWEARML